MILVYAVLLLLLLSWTYFSKKLTLAGSLTAGLVAVAIFMGTGWVGIALLGTFFFLGIAATSWQKDKKINAALAEKESSRRTAGQVLANGGAGAALGLVAYWWPQYRELCMVMLAGSFSAATADTLSSELGVLYGRRFYNILNFKPDHRGLDGVVSLEGTLLGAAGSLCTGIVLATALGFTAAVLLIIVLAGLMGNFTDSWLGATLERRGLIGNNAVNLMNTLVGAFTAGLLWNWA